MSWFGNGQARAEVTPEAAEVAALRAEVAALGAEFRTLRQEFVDTSDRLYRWMKRGEAAARRADTARLEAPASEDVPAIEVGAPLRQRGRSMWGPRARRAARQAQAADAAEEGESVNGVHS
jgi:hypothetical protein